MNTKSNSNAGSGCSSHDLLEDLFDDQAIIDQSSAMIKTGGAITNGFSLTIGCPTGADEVEIVLTYEELKAAIADLEADRTAMPHLYSSNAKPHPGRDGADHGTAA